MNSFTTISFILCSFVACCHSSPISYPALGDGYYRNDYKDDDYDYYPEPHQNRQYDYSEHENDYYEEDHYKPSHNIPTPHETYLPDCGPLPQIKNGKVEIVPDTKKASIATYFCDEGFILYGKAQRICTYGGKWSGKPSKCRPINCGYLPNIENGRLILSGTGFRDTATYLCKKGFDLIGERVRKCKEDEEWSGDAPVCAKISCPKLTQPEKGTLTVTGKYPGDLAFYRCKYGYYLDGPKRRTCERTGEWSGIDPTCKKIIPVQKKTPTPHPPKRDDHYIDSSYDNDYYYDDY